MERDRPKVPPGISRALRRDAGFGCCRCGLAVYQYHHIVPWREDKHFRRKDMMLLCPNCHDAATKGALTEAEQRRIQLTPYNLLKGFASGALMVGQEVCVIAFGTVYFAGRGATISINNEPLLRLDLGEDGELQLSIELKDSDEKTMAIIERNEWIAGDHRMWDMKSDHDKLKLWVANRKIVLDIDARATPVWVRANLWHHGYQVRLDSKGIHLPAGNVISELGLVGLALNYDSVSRATHLDPYLGEGRIVPELNPSKRLQSCINSWRELSEKPG